MYEPDQEYTPFTTDRGLDCYEMMPFELKNARATYHLHVNSMFTRQISKTMEHASTICWSKPQTLGAIISISLNAQNLKKVV